MITSKLQLAIFGAAAAAAVMALLLQHQSKVKLREENLALHEQVEEMAALESENQQLSNLVVQLNKSASLAPPELTELLKLRGEVGRLRDQASQSEKLREENRQLRAQSPPIQVQTLMPGQGSPSTPIVQPTSALPTQPGIMPLGATTDEALARLTTMKAKVLTNTAELIVAEFAPSGVNEETIDPTGATTSSKPVGHPFLLEFHFQNGRYSGQSAGGEVSGGQRLPMPQFLRSTP